VQGILLKVILEILVIFLFQLLALLIFRNAIKIKAVIGQSTCLSVTIRIQVFFLMNKGIQVRDKRVDYTKKIGTFKEPQCLKLKTQIF